MQRVWMVHLRKGNYNTRALVPFPVSEGYARMHEIAKTARRLTKAELIEHGKITTPESKAVEQSPEPVPTPPFAPTVAPEMDEATSFTTTNPGGEVTETSAPRRRGRPRKTVLEQP